MSATSEQFLDDCDLIYTTAVIGRFPEFIEIAGKLNLNTITTSERTWRFVTLSGDPTTMSRAFWRQIARAKHGILIASNPALASNVGVYGVDLKQLKELGYVSDSTGGRLRHKEDSPGAWRGLPQKRKPGQIGEFLKKLFPGSNFAARMQRALTPRGSDQDLEEKIRGELGGLFKDPSTRMVSNQKFPEAFGNAILVVSSGSVLLRVISDRDEFWFDVAPAHSPNKWRALPLVIGAIEGAGGSSLPSCLSPRQVGALLESRLDCLKEAFLPEKFAATNSAVDEVEARVLKAWIREFSN